ncbi:ML domain-containing protein [Powellomyces hirtus]|nr:ML domain-containing protein [Powellomyces hirtus]
MHTLPRLLLLVLVTLCALVHGVPTPQAPGGSPLRQPSGQFRTCSDVPGGSLQLTSLNISPNPVVAGENTTVTITANSTADITQGAAANVTVSLGGLFQVLDQQIDLCRAVTTLELGTGCPIPAGEKNVVLTREVPAGIPQTTYLVRVEAVNGDGSK